jgi:ankyrin repeat protein
MLLAHFQHVLRPPWQHLANVYQAAADGHDEVLRRHLSADPAAVHARDDAGWTPLLHAAYHGHPAAVSLLLAARADPEAYDHDGCAAAFLNCNGRPGGPSHDDARTEIERLLVAAASLAAGEPEPALRPDGAPHD